MTDNNKTPQNASSYKELVESDKRSILTRVLNVTFPTPKPTPKSPKGASLSSSENDGSPYAQHSDYDEIFGEDIDDSEELFANILMRAKEEFKKQKELKEKCPNLDVIQDIFKKPKNPRNTRKRTKSKAVENSLAIMDNFRKKLIEPPEQSLTLPTKTSSNNSCNQFKPSIMISSSNGSKKFKASTMISSSNNYDEIKSSYLISCNKDYNQFKSSIKTLGQGNQTQQIPYPTWKTTETYNPIFSAATNPRWANLHDLNVAKTNFTRRMHTPVQTKMYTPKHIDNWMDTATNSNHTEPPSCKSIRSDVAVYDSDSDEDTIKSIENTSIYFSPKYNSEINKNLNVSYKTPPTKKTMSSSTPVKSTNTVQFKPSPPEYFERENYNINYKTPPTKKTISSSTPMKSTNTVRFKPSPPEYFMYGSDSNSAISPGPMLIEENENNYQMNSPENYNEFYQGINANSITPPILPISLQNEYSPPKENIEYEEHHHIFHSNSYRNQVQKKAHNDTMNETLEEPIFFKNFVHKLNYNVNNYVNMNLKAKLKCSMKVEYYH